MTRDALDSVVNARALYYDFFAGVFLYELLEDRSGLLLEQVRILKQNALNESDSIHFELLESELMQHGIGEILKEYTSTFILPFVSTEAPLPRKKGQARPNTQVMLYLSYYLEGCINGHSLLKARKIVKQTTFRLNSQDCKESEEHLGFLLLLMRYLLLSSEEDDKRLSKDVALELAIPLGEFVVKVLTQREDLRFYSSIGHLLDSFLGLEKNLW